MGRCSSVPRSGLGSASTRPRPDWPILPAAGCCATRPVTPTAIWGPASPGSARWARRRACRSSWWCGSLIWRSARTPLPGRCGGKPRSGRGAVPGSGRRHHAHPSRARRHDTRGPGRLPAAARRPGRRTGPGGLAPGRPGDYPDFHASHRGRHHGPCHLRRGGRYRPDAGIPAVA
jgi:hypothetical protein